MPFQPSTLCTRCGLTRSGPSSDTTPPASQVVAASDTLAWGADGVLPAEYGPEAVVTPAGTFYPGNRPGGRVNVTVVAWDRLVEGASPGLVAGVEVSLDGGTRWHAASRLPKPWPAHLAGLIPDAPPGVDRGSVTLWSLHWGYTIHDWLYVNVSSFVSRDTCGDMPSLQARLQPQSQCAFVVAPLCRAIDDSLNMARGAMHLVVPPGGEASVP